MTLNSHRDFDASRIARLPWKRSTSRLALVCVAATSTFAVVGLANDPPNKSGGASQKSSTEEPASELSSQPLRLMPAGPESSSAMLEELESSTDATGSLEQSFRLKPTKPRGGQLRSRNTIASAQPSMSRHSDSDSNAIADPELWIGYRVASASIAFASPIFPWLGQSLASEAASENARTSDGLSPADETDSYEKYIQSGSESTVVQNTDLECGEEQGPVDRLGETPMPRRSLPLRELPGDTSEPVASGPSQAVPSTQSSLKKSPLRAVRIPLAETANDSEPPSDEGLAVPPSTQSTERDVEQHDPDSNPNQDEPPLMQRNSSSRELQGEDAIHAAKPGKHRKEVIIASPSIDATIHSESSTSEPPEIKRREDSKIKSADTTIDRRMQRVNACLKYYLDHPESTSVRSPWAVMHAILPYGSDYEMVSGNQRVNAIGWVCHNGVCRTQQMFTPRGNSFVPNVGDGVQGHEGQFLAILAQSNVPLNYPIQIGKNRFKVEDLVRYEMATCKEKSELTFKLIGLSYYLDAGKQWKANDGKTWNIAKLIQEELAQPIVGSACGGTHRLMGLSFSLQQRKVQGLPITGQYARAAKFIDDYVEYTWRLQNPDGSFSTNWYESRGNEPNEERKVQTSGHMLEWLLFTISDRELQHPRVDRGIDFLLSKIYDKKEQKWPIGPRGHATRAIALYEARKQSPNDASIDEPATPPVRNAIKPGTTKR